MDSPEELLHEHRSPAPLRRIAFWPAVGAALAAGSLAITDRRGHDASDDKPTTPPAPTRRAESPADIERNLGTGTSAELNVDHTRLATYSFTLQWDGKQHLAVHCDGTDVPIGLRFIPGGTSRSSVSLRPNGSATMTLGFRITDCRLVSARSLPLLLAARVGSAPWRYVAVDPPSPTRAWQQYIREMVCRTAPAGSTTHR